MRVLNKEVFKFMLYSSNKPQVSVRTPEAGSALFLVHLYHRAALPLFASTPEQDITTPVFTFSVPLVLVAAVQIRAQYSAHGTAQSSHFTSGSSFLSPIRQRCIAKNSQTLLEI